MTRQKQQITTGEAWCDEWMSKVADEPASMSQRKLDVVKAKGGGVAVLKRSAKARGVHLLQLTDDRGIELVAASTKSFKVLT